MKASKRLIKAIIALIASFVLCVSVCFAWFASNQDVRANDLPPDLRFTNVKDFKVIAYQLVNGATEGTYTYDRTKPINSDTKKSIAMNQYGGMDVTTSRALLLEFKYEFEVKENKTYNIGASCEDAERIIDKYESSADRFTCRLSDASSFYAVTVNGSSVTQGKAISFYDDAVNNKTNSVKFNDEGLTDSVSGSSFYCMIDYVDLNISMLYALALDMGGTLNSSMLFRSDIGFYIEESKD